MEFHLSSLTAVVAGIFALLLFLFHLLRISRSTVAQRKESKKRLAPEAAGSWPVIGHLHLLGGTSQLLHKVLGAMADKCGPIFTIKLGVHRALVVSSWEMAKECLNTNDKVFVNRQTGIAVEHMCYNYAMFAFSPYGPYWREVRKIATIELLSNHRLEMLKHVRESEVKASIKEIYELSMKNKSDASYDHKVLVEMKRWFGDVTLNVVVRMIAGKRFTTAMADDREGEGDRCRKALRDFFHLIGLFMPADALPFLRWLDLGGYEKEMKKTAKELDSVLEGWLEEHKQKRIDSSQVKGDQQDFMDVMLSILDYVAQGVHDADTINKSTCLALILGGTDTTTVTLTWALSLLLNNPHMLKKAQDELDIHVGKERQVKESDMKNLVYLQAILKETLRLYPAAPLGAPRESIEDCTVGGYHVPAGTRLQLNLWKIHRDPRVWSDPCKFQPERFLTTQKDVDVRGQYFELIPFGNGRRACPGISFALLVMQFTLASLLHGFEVATLSHEPIDMGESFGLTNMKATPLEVLLTPRLPANLYE